MANGKTSCRKRRVYIIEKTESRQQYQPHAWMEMCMIHPHDEDARTARESCFGILADLNVVGQHRLDHSLHARLQQEAQVQKNNKGRHQQARWQRETQTRQYGRGVGGGGGGEYTCACCHRASHPPTKIVGFAEILHHSSDFSSMIARKKILYFEERRWQKIKSFPAIVTQQISNT